ncbi:hypothetical protein [Candidatus Laterigemmans baculatus]|uniref:hypothetical protein n=1 Tax=Candidatus Laterigemmans baculatus TaxID=2770505 RepID=UPI0013D996C4|nr:hypothetical protein [Candidatus Laterigemmans baculatus]
MTDRNSFWAVAVASVIASAAFGFQAVAQNAEEGGASAEQQGKMMMCPMMEAIKPVHLYADTPAVLLAQEDSLALTEQQQEKLEEITAEARERAREILTEKQRQQLEEAPSGPLSAMQLTKLQRKEGTGNAKGAMCPMCMKMMQKMKERQGNDGQDVN